ncbi:hypothetical protein V1503_06150 [Bacillus sp. SCS-151]|uniref:hypothetical protein n=1 Tax=Nanhaiella sioensis TaxID=3115293 RepID=UPI00397D97F6
MNLYIAIINGLIIALALSLAISITIIDALAVLVFGVIHALLLIKLLIVERWLKRSSGLSINEYARVGLLL